MNRTWWVRAVIAAAVIVTGGVWLFNGGNDRGRPPFDDPTGVIVGRVKTKDHIGLPGAVVSLTTSKGTTSTESGEDGLWGLEVPAGKYDVSAVYNGKPLGKRSGQLLAGRSAIVEFENDEYRSELGKMYEEEHAKNLQAGAEMQQKDVKIAELQRDLELASLPSQPSRPVDPSPTVAEVIPPAPPVAEVIPPPVPEVTPVSPPVASAPPLPVPVTVRPGDEACAGLPCTVRLYYGTDRAAITDKKAMPAEYRDLDRFYGPRRGNLAFGEAVVTIPVGYRRGSGDMNVVGEYVPGKSITLSDVEEFDRDIWTRNLKERVARGNKEILVFIHGFNVTFPDAARRTAQMHFDLDFKGAPVFFSWPSRTGILRYWADEASIEWATPHLTEFLDLVAREAGADKVHLVAHSMGSRALTRALAEIGARNKAVREQNCGDQIAKFSQVFLAAPDLDAELFTQLKTAVREAADNVTLYASNRDRAMRLSRLVHLYPRLGERHKEWTAADVTAIDASNAKTDFLGHSYYGSTILHDVKDVLENPGISMEHRCAVESLQVSGYYRFKPRGERIAWYRRFWYRITGERDKYRDQLHPCDLVAAVPVPTSP